MQERLHFLQQSASQFGMARKREARRGSRSRSRSGVAGAFALPTTISISVWHDEVEEEGSKGVIKEEVKGGWGTTEQDKQDPPKERAQQCDDEHGKMRPKR